MEHDLKQWVHALREINDCVSGFAIQTEALRLYKIIHPEIEPEFFQTRCDLRLVGKQ